MKIFLSFVCTILTLWALLSWKPSSQLAMGVVSSAETRQAIPGARIREIGASEYVISDAAGYFEFTTDIENGNFINLAAGKDGWFNQRKINVVGIADTIFLSPLPADDNPDYVFQSPDYCSQCHTLLHNQWSQSKHALAATNPMLKQIYNGTTVTGQNGVYPGFKMDFPGEGGDCGDCHAPSAAINSPGNTEMNDVWSAGTVDTNGVHCDFCHKITEVRVNDRTGVNGSLWVQRPFQHSRDINTGPFDDVTTFWMGGTYKAVFDSSEFCSGCHQYANRFGVVVDDTYDSWKSSAYSTQGIQCQQCHMRPMSQSIFANGVSAVDAVVRDTNRVFNQSFLGSTPAFLKGSVGIKVLPGVSGNGVLVEVHVTNKGAGHKLPTGVSFRNMLLLIRVTNNGLPMDYVSGDTIPFYGGLGSTGDGNYSGLPGKGYAMLLKDAQGRSPASSWMASTIVEDSRIAALHTDTVKSLFRTGKNDHADVSVQLIYRAVYKSWADVKGWDMREFVMSDTTFVLPIDEIWQEPKTVVLHQNYPNPFNGTTRIEYDIPEKQPVDIRIYNSLGQEVSIVLKGIVEAGRHSISWNGLNFRGSAVGSGVYIYRLIAGNRSYSKKLLYIK